MKITAYKNCLGLKISRGTTIGKNPVTRQVLAHNIIKSRKEGYPVQDISKEYHVSKRTAHRAIKFSENYLSQLWKEKNMGEKQINWRLAPTKKAQRLKVKLMQRSSITLQWIRHILRFNIKEIGDILDHIDNKVKPP